MDDVNSIREGIPKETIPQDHIKRDFNLTKEGISMKLYGEHAAFYDKMRDKFVEKVTYIVITYWHLIAIGVIVLFFFIATLLGKRITKNSQQTPVIERLDGDIVAP